MSLGSILGGIVKVGAGFALGGPAGALGAAGTLLKPRSGGAVTVPYAPMNIAQDPYPRPAYPVELGPLKFGQPSWPPTGFGGNNPAYSPANFPAPAAPAGGKACAAVWDGQRWRSTHMNKSTYVTRGGGTSRWPKQLTVHPKGTECVPSRRMNPGNGRAAKHAVRRLVAFYRLSNSVAKQLRKAASRAGLNRGRGRGRRMLGPGSAVTVVDTD